MTHTAPSDRPTRRGYLLWIMAGLLLAFFLPTIVERLQYSATAGAERARLEAARAGLAEFKQSSEAFRLAAQAIGPCVVHIDTARYQRRRVPVDELGFWTREGIYAAKGQGSGVIVDAAGYIITNNHVIETAQQIQVKLSDGRTIDQVTIVGTDPLTDLAVLKIEADNLNAAPWGSSAEVQVGDWVLAVGNPFGLDRTVTAGIISAKERIVGAGERPLTFLQTDAAVNPGNSGGPLVDLNGRVIGITTAIIGSAYQGISFAIPSDQARTTYEALRQGTQLATGWIGTITDAITPQVAEQLQLETTRGALVVGIVRDSPAAEAGLRPGDVIVAIDGEPVNAPGDVVLRIGQAPIGSQPTLTILRGGEEATVKVQVKARPRQTRGRQRP